MISTSNIFGDLTPFTRETKQEKTNGTVWNIKASSWCKKKPTKPKSQPNNCENVLHIIYQTKDFYKNYIYNSHRPMKKYKISDVISERQNHIHEDSLKGMETIKIEYAGKGMLVHCWCCYELVQLIRKTV